MRLALSQSSPPHRRIEPRSPHLNSPIRLFHLLLALFIITVLFPIAVLATALDYRFTPLKLSGEFHSFEVQKIFQQRNGFIWIATDNGVSRFDGHRYQHYFYDPDSDHHISNNIVSDIKEDAEGNVWLATEFGLNRIDINGDITQYFPQDSQHNSQWILSLLVDYRGRLWVGGDQALLRYDVESDGFISYHNGNQSDNHLGIHSLAQSDDGTIYAVTNKGLLTVDEQQHAVVAVEAENQDDQEIICQTFGSIHNTASGRLLLLDEQTGAYLFEPQTKTVQRAFDKVTGATIDPAEVTSLIQLNNGHWWVGTYDGIMVFDSNREFLEHINHQPFDPTSLPSMAVYHIYQDNSGLVWVSGDSGVATYSNLRAASRLYKHTPDSSSLQANSISWLVNSDDREIWAATSTGHSKVTIGSQQVTNITLPEAENPGIIQLKQADNGHIWFAGTEGLGYIDPESGELTHYSNHVGNPYGLLDVPIYTVLPDNLGGAWFTGYYETGLAYFHPDTGVTHALLKEGHPYFEMSNFSYEKIWDNQSAIWMATSDGVFRVDPTTGDSQHFRITTGKDYIRATDIDLHPSGDLWITTLGMGLIQLRYHPDAPPAQRYQTHYASKEIGSSELSFHSLALDKQDSNRLWLTSPGQLFSLDISTNKLESYPSLIEPRELVFIEAAITQSANRLYLGSNIGIFEIDTNQLQRNRYQPHVDVTSVKSNGKELPLGNNSIRNPAKIKHQDNSIEFNFASFDFTNPAANRYRYRLIGVDPDWVDAAGKTSVTYSNLGAGNYQFIVEGSNSDGEWSPIQGHWFFQVGMAWWSWALLVLSLLVVALLIYYVRNRMAKVNYLSNMAFNDSLTGLPNRRQFVVWLNHHCKSPKRQRFCVVFVDLDDFKHINDNFGHDVGDDYICAISERLSQSLRPNDRLARLGGDEFAILLEGRLTKTQSQLLMKRLQQTIGQEHSLGEHAIQGSASFGLARYPQDGTDSTTLLKNADTAMYAAKRRGKHTFNYFGDDDSLQLKQEFKLNSEIFPALAQNQFTAYYQAKVYCDSGKVSGVEALARWIHPNKGMVSPLEFIPVAEANGAILQIGKIITLQACQHAQQWYQQGLLEGPMSVNVSVHELRQPNYVESILEILEQTGLPANMLELELTETMLVENFHSVRNVMKTLRSHGIRFSLDDFGSGYSSLAYLDELLLDTLKIDRGFISKITPEHRHNDVLSGVLELAKRLNIDVLVEGVETDLQLQFLQVHHCQQAQGYLFTKPIEATAFSEYLRNAQQPLSLTCIEQESEPA